MALELIKKLIETGKTHENYTKVCELREEYLALITDEKQIKKDNKGNVIETTLLSKYLKRFVRREDEDLFEQRITLTKHYTPSVCNRIIEVYNKALKSNRVYRTIESDDNKAAEEVNKAIRNFYGNSADSGVDEFLKEQYKMLTFTDPNAWINVTFEAFNNETEKAQPYPLLYSCIDVVDFKVVNNVTEWILIKNSYTYQDKQGKEKQAIRYVFYDKNIAYDIYEIKQDATILDYSEMFTIANNSKFGVNIYEHKSEKVPFARVGYVADIATNSQTYVNPFHYPAIAYLREIIKVTSELQLSITLHAFPQKISYVMPCDAKGCNHGRLDDGNVCGSCKGTGLKQAHTTAADVLQIPLPNFKKGEELQDISKIATYLTTPIEVLKFLDDYVDKRIADISRAMFRSESLLQTNFNTATEATINFDSIYDTLYPFAEKYSRLWMFIVGLIVTYLDYKDKFIIYHKFSSDFKIKSINQLMEDLNKAKEANASSFIVEAINDDIAEQIYADDPDTLFKIKVKQKFYPFSGKSIEEITTIITFDLTTQFYKILYANFDVIFDEIELEFGDKFYRIDKAKQREIINTKVNTIIDYLDKNSQPKIDFNPES